MTKRPIIAAGAIAAVAFTGSARAALILDLTAPSLTGGVESNVDRLLRPVDGDGLAAPFLITARTSVDPDAPFTPGAPGDDGTLYVNDDGLGVQTTSGGGSKGLSGGGGDKDEEIVFTFDRLVPAAGVRLGVADFDPGRGLDDGDDLVLFLTTGDGGQVLLDELAYMAAYAPDLHDDKRGIIDLGALSPGLMAPGVSLTALAVRETRGHTLVSGLALEGVPGAAVWGTFVACGACGACARRRR